MSTAFTRAQLDAMESVFVDRLPPLPKQKDASKAQEVHAITAAATEYGLLVRMKLDRDQVQHIAFNPVSAYYMMVGINLAGKDSDWWGKKITYQRDPDLGPPLREDMTRAQEVLSLTTASAGDVMVTRLVLREKGRLLVLLRRDIAAELFLLIDMGGKTARWWHPETFELISAEGRRRRINHSRTEC